MKPIDYILRYRKVSPALLMDKFKWTAAQLTDYLCQHWHRFPRGGMVGTMFHIDQPNNQWYIEVCDTKYKRGDVVPAEQFQSWCEKSAGKSDQHTSIYYHDREWISQVERRGKVGGTKNTTVTAPWLWLELDRKQGGYTKAFNDAMDIAARLDVADRLCIYFSGNASIHLGVHSSLLGSPIGAQTLMTNRGGVFYNAAHNLAGDARHGNGIIDPWFEPFDLIEKEHLRIFGETTDSGAMRQNLENIDPNIYSVNSLLRAPMSTHEKSGNPKEAIMGDVFVEPENTEPIFLHYYLAALTPKKKKVIRRMAVDEDIILREFADSFEDFDPDDADGEWVNGLHNPNYDDHNPSVSLNISDGRVWDFGNPEWQIDFVEFLARKYNITIEQAKRKVK